MHSGHLLPAASSSFIQTDTPGTENAKMSKAHSDTEGPTWSQELGLKVEKESETGGWWEVQDKKKWVGRVES